MVEATIRMVAFTAVRASRGKVTRAQPVSALYEQGRMHHLGAFAALEDQMCGFTPDLDRKAAGYSPDRVDALVWGTTDMLIEQMKGYGIFELYTRMAAGRIARHRQPVIADGPDPRQSRDKAIIVERRRFAALGVSRTPEEAADHAATIDRIIREGAVAALSCFSRREPK